MEGTIFVTISEIITKYAPIALAVCGAFAALATLTPNKSDDRIVQLILDCINFFGGNIGKAKNDPTK